MPQPISRAQKIASLILLWLVAGLALSFRLLRRDASDSLESRRPDRPVQVARNGYARSDSCRECHPKQHQTWHGKAKRHNVLREIVSRHVQLARSGEVLSGASPRVLMDADGIMVECKVNELMARRDERPVDLGK